MSVGSRWRLRDGRRLVVDGFEPDGRVRLTASPRRWGQQRYTRMTLARLLSLASTTTGENDERS